MSIHTGVARFLQVALTVFGTIGIAAITPLSDANAQKSQGTTLVKNVDEPGRVPYQAYIEFTAAGCNAATDCANFTAGTDPSNNNSVLLFDAPVVPTGKRLVIKWVSALPPEQGATSLSLQSSQSIANTNLRWQYHGPWFQAPGGFYGMSSAAFATYGPGERPHIRVATGAFALLWTGNVTISGYLIDAN